MGRYSRLGNDLYSGRKSVDFVGRKRLWFSVSGVILLLAVGGLIFNGLNLGIEFKGGVSYTVSLPQSQVDQASVEKVTEAVAGTGIEGTATPTVTTAGPDAITAEVQTLSNAESNQVIQAINQALPDTIKVDQDAVGPSLGAQVAKQAAIGLVVFLILVVLFIWAYFREWKMSVAALIALAHDVVITLGIYALSGFEVTPATVTGLLTILGFSLYDTVVVFDKIRENTRNLRRQRTTYAAAANLAVNQTLVRSINTSIVALLPVAAILYVGVVNLGTGPLKDLALALFVGMAAGTYSSIFIATPAVVALKANEKSITDAERRESARSKRQADRYAGVPVFTEDMAIDEDESGGDADPVRAEDDDPRPVATMPRPERTPEATGSGRTAPAPKGPVGESRASGRNQPSRQSRSRRGKK